MIARDKSSRKMIFAKSIFRDANPMEFRRSEGLAASEIARLIVAPAIVPTVPRLRSAATANIGTDDAISGHEVQLCLWQRAADNSRRRTAGTAINSIEFTRNYRRVNSQFDSQDSIRVTIAVRFKTFQARRRAIHSTFDLIRRCIADVMHQSPDYGCGR